MTTLPPPLPAATEAGALGVFQLKRIWAAARSPGATREMDDLGLDDVVRDALGIGLQQMHEFLHQRKPAFEAFEDWIVATAGVPAPETVARVNATVSGTTLPEAARRRLADIDAMPPALSDEDLARWDENGYVVLHDAVPEATRRAAVAAIWRHLDASPDDPATWSRPLAQGIMTQLFQDEALTAIRRAVRVHKAFAQLWGTADLWPTADRAGFSPPAGADRPFSASDLHWDVSLARPVPFGTQGILYLTDTPPEQGAFRCVPGFHRKLDAWLGALPQGANPREQDLRALGVRHVGGTAGDLVIWHHALPHGASPNRGTSPRIVQYLNMYPARREVRAEWI